MFSFIFGRLNIILGVAIAILIGGFAIYYKVSQNKIESLVQQNVVLQENNNKLKNAISEQKKTINRIKQNYENSIKAINELQDKLVTIEAEKKKLEEIFVKHDLTKLSEKKPSLIEKKINKATTELFKNLELLTKDNRNE